MKFLLIIAFLVSLALCELYVTQTIDEAKRAEILKFWTPERMKEARPIEDLLQEERFFPKYPQNHIPPKSTFETDYVPVEDYPKRPFEQTGKLFFTYGNRTASCSASSTGGNAVITAGHCISIDGEYHSNWIFAPQYDNGERPHGVFVGSKTMVFKDWHQRMGNMGRDVGFIIFEKQDGVSLSEKVGFMEAGICTVDNQENITAIGYPVNYENAQRMVRTHDKLRFRFLLNPIWKPSPFAISSKMEQGCSGGPWVMKFRKGENSGNVVCSVNSFMIRILPGYLFGPQFDNEVLAMRKEAIAQ